MDSEYILTTDGELYHVGVKGMKWGIRRYQNKDGSLTAAGKKRYNAEMDKIKAETKKLRNQERTEKKLSKLESARQNLENMKKAQSKKKSEEAETDDQKKERILKSPTPKDVYENRHLFSNKEIQDLSLRLNNENTIKNLVPKDVDAGKAKVDKALSKIGELTTTANNLIKTYNTVANIINAVTPLDKTMLPKIDTNITSGNRQQRRQEAGLGKKKDDKKDDD